MFLHPISKLSTQYKYGVITSQTHRYTVACTRRQDLIPAAVELYTSFVDKGYKTTKGSTRSTRLNRLVDTLKDSYEIICMAK